MHAQYTGKLDDSRLMSTMLMLMATAENWF